MWQVSGCMVEVSNSDEKKKIDPKQIPHTLKQNDRTSAVGVTSRLGSLKLGS